MYSVLFVWFVNSLSCHCYICIGLFTVEVDRISASVSVSVLAPNVDK